MTFVLYYHKPMGKPRKDYENEVSNMKKTMVKVFALLLVTVLMAGTFAGCAKTLSGSYDSQVEILGQKWTVTYTFKGSKVTVVSKATILGNVNTKEVEGKYSITENSDGSMEITFSDFEENDIIENGTKTFEEAEDYIKIGGVQFNKVK